MPHRTKKDPSYLDFQEDNELTINSKVTESSQRTLEDKDAIYSTLSQENTAIKKEGCTYDAYCQSNCLSKLLFHWSFYILSLAKKTKITISHLGTLSKDNSAISFSQNLLYYWNDKKYKDIKSNALMKTIIRANIWRIISILIMSLISSFFEYFSWLFYLKK